MKHPNVTQAFEMLLEELHTALKNTRQQAAAATQDGKYDDAQAHLDEARQIEKCINEIRAIHHKWIARERKSRPKRAGQSDRLPRGQRTPEEAFRLPILRALVALDGEAKMNQVLDRVYAEMKSHLRPPDLEPLPSDPETPRWRNTAQWTRQAMVNEGLLQNNSPRGIWAITETGRKVLSRHGG
jgi:restriction system protein